jgi:membrane dipeptidase
MKRFPALAIVLLASLLPPGCAVEEERVAAEDLRQKAERLARETLIIDTHVDVPYRLMEKMEDISQRTEEGDFDYPRAVAGGLDAPFMAIYVPAKYAGTGAAREYADKLIDLVESFEADWPEKFAVARSAEEVRRHFAEGKIALAMGIENGSAVEDDVANVDHFHRRGIRYIGLAHSENNEICDSSYADDEKWKGLSPFGREVVAAMNRTGIMVDVSHISDASFWDVMELSKAPAIASHSSCRKFTPEWERNMDDEMIKALAANGGVIQINFGSAFLRHDARVQSSEYWGKIDAYREEKGLKPGDHLSKEYARKYWKEHDRIYASLGDLVDHVDHVVAIAGIDHVGLGSDFDGLGDSLPVGLKDVSQLPNLIHELLKRGYSEEEIRKICSGNTLRVWSEVERIASEMQRDG